MAETEQEPRPEDGRQWRPDSFKSPTESIASSLRRIANALERIEGMMNPAVFVDFVTDVQRRIDIIERKG